MINLLNGASKIYVLLYFMNNRWQRYYGFFPQPKSMSRFRQSRLQCVSGCVL